MIAAVLIFGSGLACLGLGHRLQTWGALEEPEQNVAEAASAFLLGQAVLGSIWLILALAGQFRPVIVLIVSAVVLVLCLPSSLAALRGCRLSAPAGKIWWGVGLLLAGVLLSHGWVKMVLPLEPEGDPAIYYMALPKLIASHQQLVPLPMEELFSQQGVQGEMHFAALMSLGADTGAKGFTWLVGLAAALVLLGLGAQTGLTSSGRWVVLVMLLTSSAFTDRIADGKVDLFGAGLGLAACYWALRDRPSLCGLFLGFSVMAKLSLSVSLTPVVLILLLWRRQQRRVSALLCLGGCALLAFAPHLLKNGLLFGNPLLPFSSPQGWDSVGWYSAENTRYLLSIYPLALVYGFFPMQGGCLSVLMVAFAPLVLLIPRPPRLTRSRLVVVVLAGLVGLLCWTVVRPGLFAPRFLLPTLLVLMLPVARGAQELLRGGGGRILCGLTLSCLLLAPLFELYHLHHRVIRGTMQPAPRQRTRFYFYRPFESAIVESTAILNRAAPTGARVFFGTGYSYHLRPDLLQLMGRGPEAADLLASKDGWSYLDRRGFRFVLLDRRRRQLVAALGRFDEEGTFRARYSGRSIIRTLFQRDQFVLLELEGVARSSTKHIRGTRWEVLADEE